MIWKAQTEREWEGVSGSAAGASCQQMLQVRTIKQQTYLNFRVEGIACELKTDLVISLKNTDTVVQLYSMYHMWGVSTFVFI